MRRNMKINDIYVEPPSHVGDGTQFFLQTTPPKACACGAHIHNVIELLYVKNGSYSVLADGVEYEISEGDLILFCSNTIHRVFAKNLSLNQYYVIKIDPTFFLQFSSHGEGVEQVMRFAINRRGSKNIWRKEELEGTPLHSVLLSLTEENTDLRYASGIAVKLKIMELLVEILRGDRPTGENAQPSSTTALIYNTMVYVRRHYTEDIDERALAKSLGVSYSYFSRTFHTVLQKSFSQYVLSRRLETAARMLGSTDLSVEEISYAVGFGSPSYFIARFREAKGMSPSRFRRALSGGME